MGNNPQINKASRCAVIGHGSWATALVKVLTMNELSVGWYVRNADVLESLRVDGRNCRYLSEIEFDLKRLRLSDDLTTSCCVHCGGRAGLEQCSCGRGGHPSQGWEL